MPFWRASRDGAVAARSLMRESREIISAGRFGVDAFISI